MFDYYLIHYLSNIKQRAYYQLSHLRVFDHKAPRTPVHTRARSQCPPARLHNLNSDTRKVLSSVENVKFEAEKRGFLKVMIFFLTINNLRTRFRVIALLQLRIQIL